MNDPALLLGAALVDYDETLLLKPSGSTTIARLDAADALADAARVMLASSTPTDDSTANRIGQVIGYLIVGSAAVAVVALAVGAIRWAVS